MKFLFGLLVSATVWGLSGCEKEEESQKSAPPVAVAHEDGRTQVAVDSATQARIGLQVAPLTAVSVAPEIRVLGRVLDPASLIALAGEQAAARAKADASQREVDRLQLLYRQQQNISTRTLEVARSQAKVDAAAAESVHQRIQAAFGVSIGAMGDLAAFVRPLAELRASLARVELPLDFAAGKLPPHVELAAATTPSKRLQARTLGLVVESDSQLQTRGMLVLTEGGSLPSGTGVSVWLEEQGMSKPGVLVPEGALLRYLGLDFVYVRVAPERFLRTRVVLDRPTENGWLVTSGVHEGDVVVTVGAQQLLSAEVGGATDEE